MRLSSARVASAGSKPRVWRRALTIAAPLLVIAAAALGAIALLDSQPTAHHDKATKARARLVTATPARAAPARLWLVAHGTVEAARSTALRARAAGQIEALVDNLAPGTRFSKGEVLARIDASDYRLALVKAKSRLDNARAALKIENGRQAVARRELSLVGKSVSQTERHLALRGPQLAQAKANIESAQSALDQARLDLKRTRVRAPFTGIVTARDASVGDVVATSDTLATIAASNAYWVDVTLPVDQLRWLHAARGNRPGTAARIYYPDAWGAHAYLPATVLRIQAKLANNGRMARVLLRVPDPLGRDDACGHRARDKPRRGQCPPRAPLLLGAYVRAKIHGKLPDHSVLIDSSVLHENNHVWVMTANNTLDIRSVKVVYRDANRAVVSRGLAAGESVVTSELTAPVQGMPLRVEKTRATAVAKNPRPRANGTARSPGDRQETGRDKSAGRDPDPIARGLRLAPRATTLAPLNVANGPRP